MCRNATQRSPARAGLLILLVALGAGAQTRPLRLDWRHVGNAALDLALPGPATGPVDRVWYSADGRRLSIQTSSGRVFETEDFESWRPGTDRAPAPDSAVTAAPPEPGAQTRDARPIAGRIYAVGRFVYRSEDAGLNWTNLSAYRGQSILGDGLKDLAVSPGDPDELVVAGKYGVWRSLDGGMSWSGLNQALPNLPVRRIAGVPSGARGAVIWLQGSLADWEWTPGEKTSWKAVVNSRAAQMESIKQALSATLGAPITAVAVAGDWIYAGASDGRIWSSSDGGATWPTVHTFMPDSGSVEQIFVDGKEPRLALAVFARPAGVRGPQIARTVNGGSFWDDLTNNLPDGSAHGVVADRASGAIYAATDRGVFYTVGDLTGLGPATPWTPLSGNLPAGRAVDVVLDGGANQLYAAIDGYGVFAANAPHRARELRIVNTADYSARPAAPGSLLSILGSRVQTARTGDANVPVLAATDAESQIQVPFEARGSSITLNLEASVGRVTLGVPLEAVSPAIFVDRDGAAMLLDGDSGQLLDAMTPARSGMRLQILAAGLGRVQPEWPTGMAAPLENPPHVAAAVSVFLDRAPLEVTRATLAPGYVGYYLIEVQLPGIVNEGPAELYVQAEGRESNRVRVYIAP